MLPSTIYHLPSTYGKEAAKQFPYFSLSSFLVLVGYLPGLGGCY